MTTAFVLSGGGNLGAVQVGMLQALRERRIVPDLLVGTSVGALNAAYLAGRGMTDDGLDELARMWRQVRRKDIFPFDPFRQMLAVTGQVPSLYSNEGLRRLIAGNVGYRQLQDAAVPIHVVAANVLTGEAVRLSTGNTVSAVLASAAIPAVFHAVKRDGMMLCDGAIAANAGLAQAVDLGADEIYLLPSGYALRAGAASAQRAGHRDTCPVAAAPTASAGGSHLPRRAGRPARASAAVPGVGVPAGLQPDPGADRAVIPGDEQLARGGRRPATAPRAVPLIPRPRARARPRQRRGWEA